MEPKFQSSFIPKSPSASASASASANVLVGRVKEKNLFSVLSSLIFTISVVAALGTFGYKYYLKYNIARMGADLESARATIQPKEIDELTHIDNRLVFSKELVAKHQILTPIFNFLESSTVKNVRFDNIKYTKNDQDTELSISGEARGYAALAFQVDIFKKSPNFKNFNIYDLSLGDKGDVKFSFKTTVDDSLISYQRVVDQGGTPTIPAVPVVAPVATSTPAVNSLPKSNI